MAGTRWAMQSELLPLLALLRDDRHLIATTRHTDEHNVSFQPGASYQLMRFS
jgi:hypothetical protein